MKLLASLIVSCSIAIASAQSPARDATSAPVPAPVGTAAIGGIVKDADGQPLRRALVSIEGDMRVSRSTLTEDDGRFSVEALPPGRFTVSAEKGGYPQVSYGAKHPGRTGSGVLLAQGQKVTDIALTLARGGVLTGVVYDDLGQPMPGVPVQPWEITTSLTGERKALNVNGNGSPTDDRGRYRFYGLPPGEYTVGTTWFYSGVSGDLRVPTDAEISAAFSVANNPAAAPAPQKAPDTRSFNFAKVYFPTALDPLAAATIKLAAGEERDGIDIHMQLRPMSKIEGTVTGADGKSIGMVIFGPSANTQWSANPDGTFATSSLGPGDYTIFARTRPPAGEPVLFAMQAVTISGPDPVDITLTLQPAMTLTGKIMFDGTSLQPPADLTKLIVQLITIKNGVANNSGIGTVDAAGGFSIEGVTPGSFRLNASVTTTNTAAEQPRWRIGSVVVDGRDVTDLPLDVTQGAALSATVTFTDQSADLSGTVTADPGQRASDYFVVVLPADRRYWQASRRIVSTRPDANGKFAFHGLPAGEYRIAATTDLAPNDLRDPAALGALFDRSAPVTLALGEKKTFDLKIGG